MSINNEPPTGVSADATHRPWHDHTLDVEARVDALLADLAPDEAIRVACNDFGALERRGLPAPVYTDGPAGVRDAAGVTALPSCIALAATFDPALATKYGAALGREARHLGRNVVLGPTLDIARDPCGGRLAEGFGEDPELVAQIGVGHALGVHTSKALTMLKHLIGNNFESRRTGWGVLAQRGDSVDVRIDETTMHETYLRPFRRAAHAGIWSMMVSYNRLNGRYTCQSPDLLDIPRARWGWPGFYAPDYIFAVRDADQAFRAGLDLPALGGAEQRTPAMVAAESLDAVDVARRVARALIGGRVADEPTVAAAGDPTSASHQRLARRIAAQATVLLANRNETLPFKSVVKSVAVIGPAGPDAIFTIGGSASVTLDPARMVTPIEGIRRRAGAIKVEHAQGSWGDAPLPDVPAEALTLPDGSESGVELVVRHTDAQGEQVERREILTQVSIPQTPEGVTGYWTATVRTRLTAHTDGRHRLSLLLAGHASLSLDGEILCAGAREACKFIDGPPYPLQVVVDLRAHQPRLLEISYEFGPALDLAELGLLPGLRLGWQPPDQLRQEAADVAARCEVAVVLVNAASGEGMDRAGLALPGDQDDLVRAVAAANPRTVVVLNTPGAVLMPWLESVQGVLAIWYPGESFGDALADVLFGDVVPGGRLPITFPHATDDLPGLHGSGESPLSVSYDEGNAVGYRHLAANHRSALFPFGYGLSYGAHDLRLITAEADGLSVRVTVRLTETSGNADSATVQIYGRPSTEASPARLIGFTRTLLQPHQTRDITVELGPDAWSYFDDSAKDLITRDGTHELIIGEHAEDPGQIAFVDIAGGQAVVRL